MLKVTACAQKYAWGRKENEGSEVSAPFFLTRSLKIVPFDILVHIVLMLFTHLCL